MKRFESFDTFKWKFSNKTSDENLVSLLEYVIQAKIVLDDMKNGKFNKSKLKKLLELNSAINVEILPTNIKNILLEHRKDFYSISVVIGKITIKKYQLTNKIDDCELLKKWLNIQINKI